MLLKWPLKDPHLGAPLGVERIGKVEQWSNFFLVLHQPHTSMQRQWSYLSRCNSISHYFERLYLSVDHHLCDDQKLFALPAKMGSLNLRNPAKISDSDFEASRKVCCPLIDRISAGMSDYSFECLEAQLEAKFVIKLQHERSHGGS